MSWSNATKTYYDLALGHFFELSNGLGLPRQLRRLGVRWFAQTAAIHSTFFKNRCRVGREIMTNCETTTAARFGRLLALAVIRQLLANV